MAERDSKSLTNDYERFIDVERAIASKNKKILRFLPRFLLNYVKKIVHQDELNDAINRNKHRIAFDFVDAATEEFGVTIKVLGEENIPKEGGIILAANHPLGGLDGIAFMSAVGHYRRDIKFFVNDLLLQFKNFSQFFVPVNKHGKNTSDYTKKFEEVYAADVCILIFPAGLVSRRQKGKIIEDLPWKKSFITKAIKYKKTIVPVFIDGRNSNFFYNFAYWRKKIGIKANIEMLYLPDEMYKQKGKTLTFTFGKPISWETFTKDKSADFWAKKVREEVYNLGNKKS
ncbi:MAG: 1-acyl-sn-glycerol-3-phosphate acyltransferase [Bacteroidota bacterium]